MVYDYIITLKKPDFKVVDIISYLLYFIAFCSFVFFSFSSGELNKVYLLIAIGILASWIWLVFKKRKGKKIYFTAGLAIAVIGWCSNGPHSNWWIGALYVLAALAEREFKFPKEIGFSTEEIVLNSLLKKKFAWSEVKNAMIKEGIVTIDFKNNKLIQKEIDEGVAPATEVEFNGFCRQQLNSAKENAAVI